MRTLRIHEHERIPIKVLGKKNSQRLMRHLERLRYPGVRPRLDGTHLRFSGVCGLIGIEDLLIEIVPKLFDRQHSAMAVLVRMLVKVGKQLHLYPQHGSFFALGQHDLLDVMIGLYLDQLESQLKRGLLQHYATKHEQLPSPRGKLLVHRLSCEPHPLRFPCERRPLQCDHPINRTLKASLQQLRRHTRDNGLATRVQRLLHAFAEVADQLPPPRVVEALQVGRAQARWAPVLLWAKALLRGNMPGITAGTSRVCTLLFPMHQLFQDFIHASLQSVVPASCSVALGNEQNLASAITSGGKNLVQLKPDHIVRDAEGQVTAILDSKWKHSTKPAREDLYQMFAYATTYRAQRVGLLYPSDEPRARQSYRFNAWEAQLDLHYLDLTQLATSQHAFEQHLAEVIDK